MGDPHNRDPACIMYCHRVLQAYKRYKKRADERTVIEAELKDITPPVIRWITPQNPQEM